MRTPMPSPRGTNVEKLFLNRNPAGAYDSALPEDAAAELLEFLRDKLSPEDHAAFAKMLGIDPHDAMDDSPELKQERPKLDGAKFGEDARRRRRPAMDAASEAEFARRFPHAARIKVSA